MSGAWRGSASVPGDRASETSRAATRQQAVHQWDPTLPGRFPFVTVGEARPTCSIATTVVIAPSEKSSLFSAVCPIFELAGP
jgi:hypothetical protein